MFLMSFIRKLFALIGVLLFLGTLVFPFMSFKPISLQIPEHPCNHIVEFWSFMMRDTVVCFEMFSGRFGRYIHYYCFSDYWFHSLGYWMDFRDDMQRSAVENEIAWTLITLFMVQIVTLIAAATSIFIGKKFVCLTPAISCLITALLMVSTLTLLNQKTYNKFNYELGYWLTYPTEALFIANSLMTTKFQRTTQQNPTP